MVLMEQVKIAVTRLRFEIYHVISRSKVINGGGTKEEAKEEVQQLYELFFHEDKSLNLFAAAQIDITGDVPLRIFVQYLQCFIVFSASLCNESPLDSLLTVDNTRKLINLFITWIQCYESNGSQDILNIEEPLFLSVESLLQTSLQTTLALIEVLPDLSSGVLLLFLDLLKLLKEISGLFKTCFQHINPTLLKKHTILLWENILPNIFQFQELSSLSVNKEIASAISLLNGELNTLLVWVFLTPRTVVDLFALKLTSKPTDIPQYQIEQLQTTHKLHLSAHSKKDKVKRIAIEGFIDVLAHYSLMHSLTSTITWEGKRILLTHLCKVYVEESSKIRDVDDGYQETHENQNNVNGKKKRKFMEIMATELRSSRHNLARLFHFPLLLIDRMENRFLAYSQYNLFQDSRGGEANKLERLLDYLKLKIELISFLKNQLEDRFISQQSLFQKYYQYLQQDFELVLDNLRQLSSIAATASASTSIVTSVPCLFTFQAGRIPISLNLSECIEMRISLIKYLQQLQSIRTNYAEKELKEVLTIFFQDQTLILNSISNEKKERKDSVLSFPLLKKSDLDFMVSSDKPDTFIRYYASVIDFLLSTVEIYSQLRDLPLLLGSMIHLAGEFPSSSMDVLLRSVIFKEKLQLSLVAIPQGQWKTVLLHLLKLDSLVQEKLSTQIQNTSESFQCPTTTMVIIGAILDAGVKSQFRELDHVLVDSLYRDILKLLLKLAQLLALKSSPEVLEDALNLINKTLQFSSKYFHQAYVVHRVESIGDNYKEESLSMYHFVCDRLIPHMRVVDQEILPLFHQQQKISSLSQVHSLINTVLQHKLSVFQFLINDYRAPQRAESQIQEVKSSFCQLIRSITLEKSDHHLILSIYSYLLQTIQLWWEFFSSTNITSLLKVYPIFQLGLEAYLHMNESAEKTEELNLNPMIIDLRNKSHISIIQQHLNSSSISEFPVMQHLVTTKISDLINSLSIQEENVKSIQVLMRSLSNDFFQHLPENLLQVLIEGAAKIVHYCTEVPSESASSLLFYYLSTVNRCLRNRFNRNNWMTFDHLHLKSEKFLDLVPVLLELLLSQAQEIRASVQTVQEIESLTHYVMSFEAINSILTMVESTSLSLQVNNFFEYPMLMLVRLLDVLQEVEESQKRLDSKPTVFSSFHSIIRILHFTGIKVMEALRAFAEQRHLTEFHKAKVLMKIINKHHQSFQSMRKLFVKAKSPALRTVIAAFMGKMMSWIESEYDLLVITLQASNRLLLKRLLRQTEATKVTPVRLVCSEIILSSLTQDPTSFNYSSLQSGTLGYLMNSSVLNLILRFTTEIDNDPSWVKCEENGNDRMLPDKPAIKLQLFEKFRTYLCYELQHLFRNNTTHPLLAINVLVMRQNRDVDENAFSSLDDNFCEYNITLFQQSAVVLIVSIVSSEQEYLLPALESTLTALQIPDSVFPDNISQHQRTIINNLLSFSIAQKTLHHLYEEHNRIERIERKKCTEENYWRAIELLQTKVFLSAEVLVTALTTLLYSEIENEKFSQQFSFNCLRKVISESTILLKVILKPNSFQLQLESEQQHQTASQSKCGDFFKQLSMKHVKFFADKSFQVLARINTAISSIIRWNLEEQPEYRQNCLIEDSMRLHYLQLEFLHHLIMLSSRSLIPNIFSKLSVIELVIIQTMRVFPFFFSYLKLPTVTALYAKAVELFNRIIQLISSISEFEKQYFMILVGILHELKNPNYQHQQFFYGLFPLYGKLGKKDKNRVFHLLDSTGKEILNQLVADYRRMYRYDDSSN